MDSVQENIAIYLKDHSVYWQDSKRLKAILADIIPEDKGLRHTLQIAYDEGITEKLKKAEDINRCIFECKRILTSDYMLSHNAADAAIEIWAMALDRSYSQNEKSCDTERSELYPQILQV